MAGLFLFMVSFFLKCTKSTKKNAKVYEKYEVKLLYWYCKKLPRRAGFYCTLNE